MRFPVLPDEMKATAQEQGHGFLEKGGNADKDQKQVIVRHRRNAAPADGAGAKPAPRERAADGGKP